MASGAMPFILPITAPTSDIGIWPVSRFQLVFLNLPETREERVRRDERDKIRLEEGQRRHEEMEMMQREIEQSRMELRARAAAWYA